ncbi:protoporphyrinogen oxidase HemJ [Acuticoccus sp. MNP-M23]|uniref:protoporphyrinogen oxidase HemJ n=1 Tax=Acuticoccus sp. MNP-M23 TaxID=3072793 RepID=UPI002814BD8D|nr:protoporphyrinogen oxidase HemJ [Acuticoccus sp. MNP-M23]WMS44276.1 protoporphyrinogen oxidase HemJ [Acuticoccus sp. MNP-M23]
MTYLWIKALHVLAIISWMAALLYLPRLMVYHTKAETGSVQSETFKTMERRLLRGIALPSMVVAWATGLTIATMSGAWSQPWFHLKLAAVIVITAMHMANAAWVRGFRNDANTHSEKFYRIMNEVPAVFMVVVVVAVIVKPF